MGMRIPRSAGLIAAIALCPAIGLGQMAPSADVAMPSLPAASTTVEGLVPAGWTMEQRHQADFDGDRRADVLLLLRPTTGQEPVPPRILLVALALPKAPGYALLAANGRLVPRDPSGALEDPMADGGITVRPGGFDLKLGMMPGVGSYLAATMRYRFRLENGCFRLIGYDRAETHRGTLDTRDLSINFLTGVVVRSTGNAQSNKTRTERQRLPANPRRCLGELGNGWTFDPLARAASDPIRAARMSCYACVPFGSPSGFGGGLCPV
jgi:hypothetical protein